MALFDAPAKDDSGMWHTNYLAQLCSESKAVLALNPASWLGALGNVLLVSKLRELSAGAGAEHDLLHDAALAHEEIELLKPFLDVFTTYALPSGYALDADAVNTSVVFKKASELHDDKREVVIIDLLAFAQLVSRCCDLVADKVAAGKVVLPEALLLKSKQLMVKRIRHALRVVSAALHEHKKRVARSPKWRSVEKRTLMKFKACAACQSGTRLQVHHKQPFHLHPELELDETNLIVLCMSPAQCHLLIGHGGSFKCYNPNVEADARAVLQGAALADVAARAKLARLS